MSKDTIIWIVIAVLVIAAIIFGLTRMSGDSTETGQNTNQEQTMKEETDSQDTAKTETANDCTRNYDPNKFANTPVDYKNKVVTLQVRGFGAIKIAPDDKAAPKTAENFVKLAASGFYDCLTFHRVAKDFVIQGGDPSGNGTGGPGYTVPAEISLKHEKGSVAMARTGDQVNPERASSGSQFYIALNALPMLDGAYTVFGQVVEGMDIVEKIGKVEILGAVDGPPKEPVVIEKVTVANK
jgi:peptidyl-prolyl cis-trans isomerase B (cyclophilin B)